MWCKNVWKVCRIKLCKLVKEIFLGILKILIYTHVNTIYFCTLYGKLSSTPDLWVNFNWNLFKYWATYTILLKKVTKVEDFIVLTAFQMICSCWLSQDKNCLFIPMVSCLTNMCHLCVLEKAVMHACSVRD